MVEKTATMLRTSKTGIYNWPDEELGMSHLPMLLLT